MGATGVKDIPTFAKVTGNGGPFRDRNFDRSAVPGLIVSIQTFGSYAANFRPHIHALATQGAFRSTGEFVEVGTVSADVREQLFRRLVLTGLHRAERLSAEFRDTLERTLIVKR